MKYLLPLLTLLLFQACQTKTSFQSFDTIHGKLVVEDPLALALIKHPNFQRMKKIQQHGLNHLNLSEPSFTRFEHSLGVYALLKKHGASREEQIAGLLHDVSHTAFSHVGDTFFGHEDGKASWQDLDHNHFLKESGLAKLVEEHGLSLNDIEPKQSKYKRLEQDLPDLCADRINYILHGGIILKRFSRKRAKEIDDSLTFDPKKSIWYFKDTTTAYDFSQASLWQTENCWGHSASFSATHWFVEAVKEGISQKLVTQKDFRWGTDEMIWNKLEASQNKKILSLLNKIKKTANYYTVKKTNKCMAPYHKHKFKLRGVDPFVLSQGKLMRLSQAKF